MSRRSSLISTRFWMVSTQSMTSGIGDFYLSVQE